MSDEDENDWLFDYMMHVFKAPTWEAPIMQFIDDNCIIFDNEDENKFCYSDIHQTFIVLAEDLLIEHLKQVGVSEKEFIKSCEAARYRRDVNSKAFDQLMAIDDFITFKKMMCDRNIELEMEVINALKAYADGFDAATDLGFTEDELSEQRSMYDIIRKSEEEGKMDSSGRLTNISEDDNDVELKKTMLDFEAFERQRKRELAEIEKAIAMSLMIEEKRLLDAEDEEEMRECEAIPVEDEDTDERAVTRITTDVEEGKSESKSPETAFKIIDRNSGSMSKQTPSANSYTTISNSSSSCTSNSRAPSKLSPVSFSKKSVLAPIGRTSSQPFGKSKLPNLKSLEKKKIEVESVLASAKLSMSSEATTRNLIRNEVDVDVMERRRQHLKTQKERLLDIKRKKREQQLKAFQKENAGSPSTTAAYLTPVIVPSSPESKMMSDKELKREAMKAALAHRLKIDMAESRESRSSTAASVQFMSLDEQLREVEEMRKKNKIKEAQMYSKMREQMEQRARNVASSSPASTSEFF